MLAPGRYLSRAIDSQLGYAETGTEQVAVTFEITEEGDFQGQTITWFGYLTPAASENTIKSLLVCGWSGADVSDLSGMDRNEVEIVVEHEVYNDVKRARVKWINRPGAGAFVMKRPMTEAQKRSIAQKTKSIVTALRRHEPRGPSQQPARTSALARPPSGREYPENWDDHGGGL
jgi:hypothetical protein